MTNLEDVVCFMEAISNTDFQISFEEKAMNHVRRIFRTTLSAGVTCTLLATIVSTGCVAVDYQQKRLHGQKLMAAGTYGAARHFFIDAESVRPRRVGNLYDLGTCSMMLAKQRLSQKNELAAERELDTAIAYYSQALEVSPGHQPSIEGVNIALELKGQFDKALEHAEWTAKFVGPAARQYLFLAKEHEERGDIDTALLRYKQAIAMEPGNAAAHVTFAKFLLRTQNEPAAVHHLKAAYRLDPTDPWTLSELSARGVVPVLDPVRPSNP